MRCVVLWSSSSLIGCRPAKTRSEAPKGARCTKKPTENSDALSLAAQHHPQQAPEVKLSIPWNKIYTSEEWTSKKQESG